MPGSKSAADGVPADGVALILARRFRKIPTQPKVP